MSTDMYRSILILLVGAVFTVLVPSQLLAANSNWPAYGLDNNEQRFSKLDQINQANVNQLGLAWWFETDFNRGLEATPIVLDGIMYFTGNWSVVYAVDALTGKLLWRYDPEVPKAWGKMACCDVVNRGVAVADGKVVFGALDTRLIALDQRSGELLWQTKTADTKKWPYTITGAPRIANGKVFIGNGGAEYGVRGFVAAYDLQDGEQLWKFYTVPGNPADGFENEAMARAAQTWNGQWWKFGGGGTVWDSIVYDEELNQLYIGVGNGSPWNREIRSPGGGDNLYLSSIVALNPDSGEYLWHYQETPAETWDYTATQPIMLAETMWQGEQRKVIWHAPKNGFFFVIDRTNGKLLSAEPFARVNWASGYDLETGRPIFTEDGDYKDEAKFVYPSSGGAHNWHPMAYSSETGLVYIPVMDVGVEFATNNKTEYTWGEWNLGVEMDAPSADSAMFLKMLIERIPKGSLLAWDPVQQKAAWALKRKYSLNGGVLATAGKLVFQGTGDGRFTAVDAVSGKELWSYPTQVGVIAPPVTYTVNGEQYVSVLAGWGGVMGLAGGLERRWPVPNGRMLTFKLGGNAQLPELPTQPELYPLPERPAFDEEAFALGRNVYQNYCYMCHGNALSSSNAIPDLRNLPMAFYKNWDAIVRDGMMAKAGMAGFGATLSKAQTDAVYAYVVESAYAHRAEQEDTFANRVKAFFYRILTEIFNFFDALAA
ncbi:MAG: PQQ-dependent dehydrogenase, methanol/ethanol family [Gammaproteobacteria bacterium]|nr:PQQ-dependent dehydrogenase, methanol/ethanol family [Gammaproteobacteria bacterium]